MQSISASNLKRSVTSVTKQRLRSSLSYKQTLSEKKSSVVSVKPTNPVVSSFASKLSEFKNESITRSLKSRSNPQINLDVIREMVESVVSEKFSIPAIIDALPPILSMEEIDLKIAEE